MTIRQATLAMLVLAATIAGPSLAQSQGATTVVVPFPAGGALDSVARIVTQALNDRTKASYIVDNRPGANGMIGARDVAKARPNGATWLMADGAAVTINPFLYPNDKSFDAEKELRPVRALASQGLVLVVRAGFPAKSIKDFVELARPDVRQCRRGFGKSSRDGLFQQRGRRAQVHARAVSWRAVAPAGDRRRRGRRRVRRGAERAAVHPQGDARRTRRFDGGALARLA
jgi:tripartite-type tricarboxylate transporter receptor subunit TctC